MASVKISGSLLYATGTHGRVGEGLNNKWWSGAQQQGQEGLEWCYSGEESLVGQGAFIASQGASVGIVRADCCHGCKDHWGEEKQREAKSHNLLYLSKTMTRLGIWVLLLLCFSELLWSSDH